MAADSYGLREASAWLNGIYSDVDNIEVEIDDHTIKLLQNLVKLCRNSERLSTVFAERTKPEKTQLVCQGNDLKSLMSAVGLSNDELSLSGINNVNVLASTAAALGINECDMTSYAVSVFDVLNESGSQEILEDEKRNANTSMHDNLTHALSEQYVLEKLEEVLSQGKSLESALCEKQSNEAKYLTLKSREYSKDIASLQETLNGRGVTKDVHHDNLLTLSDKLNSLEIELVNLKSKFSPYQSLPPELNAAKVKVEEKRLDLERLEKSLYDEMAVLQF